jgi:crotonobetainyl-CoA:carnitine CoA-transferase CaiB-like acyl-CoA transferase
MMGSLFSEISNQWIDVVRPDNCQPSIGVRRANSRHYRHDEARMTAAERKPLSDVRVLDLAVGAGGGVGRFLAELGADVAKLEARGGDPERRSGLRAAGISLAFVAASLGKRSIALDLEVADDRAIFDTLAGEAHLLLETTRPGSKEAKLLDVSGLRARYPGLVVLSLTDFGTGACQDWIATDAVLQALNGELSRSGIPGRRPLLPPGELAVQCAIAQAAYATMLAYLHRQQTGVGDHLDISLLDGATQALDPGYGIAGSAASGLMADQLPRGRPNAGHQYPIFACKDGHVRLCVLAPRQWRGLFEWMGRPVAFADPGFSDLVKRNQTPALMEAIATFLVDKTREQIEAESQHFRVPTAAILTLDEALDSQHVRERSLLHEIELAPGVTAPFPNGLIEIDGLRATTPPFIPPSNGCAETLLRHWSAMPPPAAVMDFGELGRPLKGIRVLDLGVIVVGSEQGRLLADYGADIMKVESTDFPDGIRLSSPSGMSPSFAAGHRNKRGLGLNLRSGEGRELFLKLVERSDIVLSNFKPGTMASLDLSGETLLARNPRLIVVESSAYGEDGPWAGRMGYGPLVRASAGLTSRWRYADDPAGFGDTVTTYPDHVAARLTISAVLALLLRRASTGRGGWIRLAQMEVILCQMAATVAANILARRGVSLDGGAEHDVPWGVFSTMGDDDWCVVSIRGDEDWRRLCRAMDRPDLAEDPTLKNRVGRVGARALIDGAVTAWTEARTAGEAASTLQHCACPKCPTLSIFVVAPCSKPSSSHSFLRRSRSITYRSDPITSLRRRSPRRRWPASTP